MWQQVNQEINGERGVYREAGPADPCRVCGERINAEQGRWRFPDGTAAHAWDHQCASRESR